MGEGNNWCSPYKGWNTVYEVDPLKILEDLAVSNLEKAKANIDGGEVAMWTEQTDDNNLLSKVESYILHRLQYSLSCLDGAQSQCLCRAAVAGC